jgi:NAD(P)-dependent dehydrogenase (short-subunit alcohol dehydrogenase family)
MKEFKDKVAVVTGAASGIGRAMAKRFAVEGMKVVLADIEQGALAETEGEMKASGATVLAVSTDVSKATDVEALAKKTVNAFGAVHVFCNNAGVGSPGGPLWKRTVAD